LQCSRIVFAVVFMSPSTPEFTCSTAMKIPSSPT
jgi:hypothetical protein